MGRIKSAHEIAMEKAEEISENTSPEEEARLEIRDELKPILSKFYNGDIDAEGLWQKLEDEDEDYLIQAQEMIIESFGLRTDEDEFDSRKEAILALESLKSNQATGIEQVIEKIKNHKQKHEQERERLEEQLQQETERNSKMQMKPVQTDDGRTVMKLESGVKKKKKKKYKNALSQLEEKSNKRFNWLIKELKNKVSS